mmetsp:Transcript_30507/g.32876  ORF Transcript_30507/g.32876 Transcript_30507/m.32876 type:complete len:230 (+) Transcript_30507:52-741(+)
MAFNSTQNNDQIPVAVAAPVEPVVKQEVMTYGEPTEFLIKNNWFGGGNAEITSNGEAVFQMIRMGGSVLFKNCELVINNISGEPILSMKEHTYGSGRAMELCRVDPSSPNPAMTAVPICRVVRNNCKLTLHNRYEVQLLGQTAENYSSSVDCNGNWPKSFTFEASGKELATVQKSSPKNWKLNVSAGGDVLLFIGIACAIDRMSHESKQRKAIIFGTAGAIGAIGTAGN